MRFDTPIADATGVSQRPAANLENLCRDPLERLDPVSRLTAQPFVMPFANSLAALCAVSCPGSRDPWLNLVEAYDDVVVDT